MKELSAFTGTRSSLIVRDLIQLTSITLPETFNVELLDDAPSCSADRDKAGSYDFAEAFRTRLFKLKIHPALGAFSISSNCLAISEKNSAR